MIIEVNQTKIFVEKRGKGYPLVFVHGNGEDHHIFDVLVKKLERDYTCYLIDSRNHGQSEVKDQIHYDVMADDIYEVIQHYNLEKPYFIGFSDGGIIGVLISIKHPDALRKMIICGTNINPIGLKKKIRDEWTLLNEKYNLPLLKMILEEPRLQFKDLSVIRTKTLIVAGEHDLIHLSHTKAIHKHIKGSELLVVKEKNHEDYIVHRDDLYEITMNYFQKP